MKILIISLYAINTPHFETELEIAQKHIDDGDSVEFLYCNSSLFACDVNPQHNIFTCFQCINRRKKGFRLLPKLIEKQLITKLNNENYNNLKKFEFSHKTISDLKQQYIDKFDIGYGVLSSLVSYTRDSEPSLIRHNQLITNLFKASLVVYWSTINHLLSKKTDRVYVFNGRFAPCRAVFRAAQSCNVDCYMIERGSTLNHYSLYPNKLPHDRKYRQSLMLKSWNNAKHSNQRNRISSVFYYDNVRGHSNTWYSFTKNQKHGKLPTTWNPKKENIVIFLSSEDEFVAVGDDWDMNLYEDQIEGTRKICNDLESYKNINLYLRVHPNLKNQNNHQTKKLQTLRNTNLTIISADSEISTYTLLLNSSKVLVFGSTVGAEATFWGVPSILAGPSFYSELNCTYNPKSHEELISLLIKPLSPKDRLGSLIYGFYFQTYGIEFKYYKPISILKGSFKNKELKNPKVINLVKQLIKSFPPLNNYLSLMSIKKIENDLKDNSLP